MISDNLKFIKNTLYEKITEKNNSYYDSYILDSNIIIKIRDLYYKPSKFQDEEFKELMDLIHFFHSEDVLPGLGIHELSWDSENLQVDKIKYERLKEACINMLNNDYKTISRVINRKDYDGNVKKQNGGKRRFKTLNKNLEHNENLIYTACILLKFHLLNIGYGMKENPHNIFVEICDFMIYEIEIVGAYELSLITKLLFSTDKSEVDSIASMLKINSKENVRKNIWNASWDIKFVRTISAVAAQVMVDAQTNQIYNPVLVTLDNALHKNLLQFECYGLSGVESKEAYPLINTSNDNLENHELIMLKNKEIIESTFVRLEKLNSYVEGEHVEKMKKIMIKLENEFESLF